MQPADTTQNPVTLKSFGNAYRIGGKMLPRTVEVTTDNRIVMRQLNPATSKYDVVLFDVVPQEISRVFVGAAQLYFKTHGKIYAISLKGSEAVTEDIVTNAALGYLPGMVDTTKLIARTDQPTWKNYFKREGIKTSSLWFNPFYVLLVGGILLALVIMMVIAFKTA